MAARERAVLALGSNLGDRGAHLREAVHRLRALASSAHFRASSLYRTDPVDCAPGTPPFLNAAIEIECSLDPHELLAACQLIERDLGRPADHGFHTPRTVDIDILFLGEHVVDAPDLVIPHPRIAERAFVLLPLADIRPDLLPIPVSEAPGASGCERLAKSWLT